MIQFETVECIFAINQVVVYGSGPYKKYEGSTFLEDIISTDPDYMSNITSSLMLLLQPRVILPLLPVLVELCPVSITNENGFYEEAIADSMTGNQIGFRFQNPVFDGLMGTRIGTQSGLQFVCSLPTTTRLMYPE